MLRNKAVPLFFKKKAQCCVYKACIWLTKIPPFPLEGNLKCYSNNVTFWKCCTLWPLQLTLRGERYWINELLGTEVVSVKESCTANQTVTIRSRNDPLHLRLGAERGWWKDGVRCAEELHFYSWSFEVISVKSKSHCSQLATHQPLFFYISISPWGCVKHILLFPLLLYIYTSTCSPTLSLLKPLSNHCSRLTPPCQYLSGQLSVCFRQISLVKRSISTWNGTEIRSLRGSRWRYFPDDIFWLLMHFSTACSMPPLFHHIHNITASKKKKSS